MQGLAKQTHRERTIYSMRTRLKKPPKKKRKLGPGNKRAHLSFDTSEHLGPGQPESHYQMSRSLREPLELATWLGDNQDDPALEVSQHESSQLNMSVC
jgi:hypothetical protein